MAIEIEDLNPADIIISDRSQRKTWSGCVTMHIIDIYHKPSGITCTGNDRKSAYRARATAMIELVSKLNLKAQRVTHNNELLKDGW